MVGEESDAVSAHTQVKMSDAARLPQLGRTALFFENGYLLINNSITANMDPVVSLKRNLRGHPLTSLLWQRQLEEIRSRKRWAKHPCRECLYVHREAQPIVSISVDDIIVADATNSTIKHIKVPGQRNTILDSIDHVTTNVAPSNERATLLVIEDSEAAI